MIISNDDPDIISILEEQLTAFDPDDAKPRYLELGADEFTTKPLHEKLLRRSVAGSIDRHVRPKEKETADAEYLMCVP